MSYEDAENYVLFGMEYKATSSEANEVSLAILKTKEAQRYTALGMLIGSPGAISVGWLEAACAEHAALEPKLAEMVLNEMTRRKLA